MRTISLLLAWIISACTPRASSQEPAVSARFSVEATLGVGGALSVAGLDEAVAVGTTRGVAVGSTTCPVTFSFWPTTTS